MSNGHRRISPNVCSPTGWSGVDAVVKSINNKRINPEALSVFELHSNLTATGDLDEALNILADTLLPAQMQHAQQGR